MCRIVRAAASVWNLAVTSTSSLSSTRTWCSGTLCGTLISTSALPPLMRSARFDSVMMSKFGLFLSGLA